MEVAPHNALSTLLTWFAPLTLFLLFELLYTAKTFACMPKYREFIFVESHHLKEFERCDLFEENFLFDPSPLKECN